MSVPLWIFAELAIIATDLAEVIGTAIGLNLLFGIPLEIGIFITAADVFLILWLQNKGFRWIEALIISLTALIAACFVVLIAQAAAAFYTVGQNDVAEIDKAHLLLEPLLGSSLAPVLFGVALLCAGLNSTVTATMAGQIVMEGFINLRIAPWARRLITRGLAIIPAIFVILLYGSGGVGELLILSQVVLSFQLPFAIVPLVMFTASRAKMGELVAPRWLTGLCWLIAALIIVLNVNLLSTVLLG